MARRNKSKKRQKKTIEVNVLRKGRTGYAVTTNLLHNFVVRDVVPINASFDEHYGPLLNEMDSLFSEAAFLFFVTTRTDTGLHEEYRSVLTGLINNALNTFGSAVILLRNGLYSQAMVLIRQVIEICGTTIHIVGDPGEKALKDFREGKYSSTHAIGRAKQAIPILGHFWGFLSETFVHINQMHSIPHSVRPYKQDDENVKDVLACLRMTIWVCYITTELAFPTARENNRYWKPRFVDGKNAVSYEPDKKEREWAARFLALEGVGPDDLANEPADQ